MAGARHNLQVENPDWNFEAVKEGLKGIWEKRLSAIRVETSDSIAKSKFYTSLYHASFLPHALNDADGRYPSFAEGVKSVLLQGLILMIIVYGIHIVHYIHCCPFFIHSRLVI